MKTIVKKTVLKTIILVELAFINTFVALLICKAFNLI